jgi:hypothetical protein
MSHPLRRIEANALATRACGLCSKKTTNPVAFSSRGEKVVCRKCERKLITFMEVMTPQQVDHLIMNLN